MAKYLLIESRDPFESTDVNYLCKLAGDLAAAGNEVTLFLVQNGVFMARQGVSGNPLAEAVKGGVRNRTEVLADEFCLRERAIKASSLLPGVKSSTIDHLVDLLAQDGVKAVWH